MDAVIEFQEQVTKIYSIILEENGALLELLVVNDELKEFQLKKVFQWLQENELFFPQLLNYAVLFTWLNHFLFVQILVFIELIHP